MQIPSKGRTVIYKTTEADKSFMKDSHGNTPDELPAVIVEVWNSTLVNLQVINDGPVGTTWKTSIPQGELPGQWNWPVIK